MGRCTINLRGMSSSVHTHTDVNFLKSFGSEEKKRFSDFETKSLRLNKVQGDSVHSDHSLSLFAMSNSGGSFLFSKENEKNKNKNWDYLYI